MALKISKNGLISFLPWHIKAGEEENEIVLRIGGVCSVHIIYDVISVLQPSITRLFEFDFKLFKVIRCLQVFVTFKQHLMPIFTSFKKYVLEKDCKNEKNKKK